MIQSALTHVHGELSRTRVGAPPLMRRNPEPHPTRPSASRVRGGLPRLFPRLVPCTGPWRTAHL